MEEYSCLKCSCCPQTFGCIVFFSVTLTLLAVSPGQHLMYFESRMREAAWIRHKYVGWRAGWVCGLARTVGLMRSSQTNKVFCTRGEAVASERRAGSGGQGGFCSVVFVTNDSASELEGANNPEWFTSRCQSGTDWWDSVATVYWNLSKNTDPEAPKPKYTTNRR